MGFYEKYFNITMLTISIVSAIGVLGLIIFKHYSINAVATPGLIAFFGLVYCAVTFLKKKSK